MCEVGPLLFVQWQDLYREEKPFMLFIDPPEGSNDVRTTNIIYESHQVAFNDLRGREQHYSTDDHGFAYVSHKTDFEDFENIPAVEGQYFAECVDILKANLGEVDEVFVFDWRLRDSSTVMRGTEIDLAQPTGKMRPSLHAHVDQSPIAVVGRVRLHLPDRAEYLLRGRVRIVNLWRPLKEVQDWPLAVCDGSDVSYTDLVEADHVRRNYVGATCNMVYNPNHKWHYLSNQKTDEVLLIKQFDSDTDVKARVCPHGSFKLSTATPNTPPRKSIEVRALVFTFPREL